MYDTGRRYFRMPKAFQLYYDFANGYDFDAPIYAACFLREYLLCRGLSSSEEIEKDDGPSYWNLTQDRLQE